MLGTSGLQFIFRVILSSVFYNVMQYTILECWIFWPHFVITVFIFQLSIRLHAFDKAHGCLCHNEGTGFQVARRLFVVAAEKIAQFNVIK